MSAWMTGIQTGMDLARQRAAQQQQAQEFAFRQQQADINNSQQDRAFAQQQQYQDQMRQMREMEYADRKAEIARRLMQDQYDGQIFKAAAQPDMMPGAPGSVGPVQPHPLQAIPDDVILGASPSGRAAYLSSMQRNAGFQQRRQAGQRRIEMARADGTLKYMSDKDLEEFTTLGLLGELAPDEMPMSVRKKQEQEHEQLAQLMAVVRDPQTGELVSDRRTYEQFRGLDPKLAQAMFLHRQQQEAAQEQAIQRQNAAMELAKFKAASQTQRGALTQSGTRAKDLQTVRNNAEEQYRAFTAAKTAKEGPLTPPTPQEFEYAKKDAAKAYEYAIMPGVSKAAIQKAQTKVAAWERFQQADQAYMAAVNDLTTAAEPVPGLLDGPEGPQQQNADPEAIYQQIMAEMPDATDEQAAAELARRMQGG